MHNKFKVKYNSPLENIVSDKLGLPTEILEYIDNINGDILYYVIRDYSYLSVYDGQTNKKIQTINMTNGSSSAIDISPTENTIAIVNSKNNIILWDISTNNSLWIINNYDTGFVSKDEPLHIKFTQDGKFIITYLENMIRIYESTTGSLIRKIKNTSESMISFITCDFSGKTIITGYSSGEIKLFSFESGILLNNINIHKKEISFIAINNEGTLLVSGSWDGNNYIWDLTQNKIIHKLQFNKKIMSTMFFKPSTILNNIEFSFDGKYIIGVCDLNTYLWDISTGEHIKQLLDHSYSIFLNDSKHQSLLSINGSNCWSIGDEHPEEISINKINL